MAGLVKKAEGLQRFMMDCGFWRSRKWVGADLAAIGLQVCGISYSYEHGTDGRLPKDDLAIALGVREKDVRKALPVVLKRGVWAEEADAYVIVGYHDHNPTQAEVKEHRERRTTAGLKGNHDRWHKTKVDPQCPFCDSRSDPPPTSNGVAPAIPTASESDRIAESQSRVEERRVDPPLSPLSHQGGSEPIGNPETEKDNPEPPPPSDEPESLAERLAELWPGRERMAAECRLVVGRCLAVADRSVVDECIGAMLAVDDKPHSPKYLLAAVRNRLVSIGAYPAGDEALASLGGRS